MVNVITLRSPVARGSVHSVSLPSLPSGYRAIFPHDIPGKNRLASFHPDIPILAWDELSYRGQPVALIAGPDPIVLESLAANTKIDCAEEEGYLDWESFSSKQVVAKRVVTIGDPDLAFSIAPDVQDATYYTGAVYHYYSEPQGAVAAYDYDKIAIWCATQWPYHVRDSVALALGCRAEEVSVRPSRLGVHLDGKLWYPSLLACHAAVAAVACGRPAKILLTREEDFLYAPKRAQSSISIRSALGPDKELSAMDIRIAIDVGAHPALAEDILNNAILSSTGAYRCPNLRVEGYAVSTNVPPLGPFGGFGSAHTLYAIETHTNNLASLVQEDPADWKSRNILRKGSSLITGETFKDSIPYPLILERLSASSDYRRKHASYELIRKRRSKKTEGPLRGIGLAFACQGTGSFVSEENANSYSVEVELDKDLKVVIKTSAAAGSGGVLDIWRRTASDSLNIPLANVRVAPADTDESPNSGPATLSRGITIVNRLVEKACLTIQKRRFRDPLPLSAHSSYRIPKSIHWEEGSVTSSSFDSAAWAGAVVELELDPWTLESRPLGIWLCVDGGQIVCPERAVSTLRSLCIDALGTCMSELYQPAREDTAAYFRQSLLPLGCLPPISVDFLQPSRKAPVKGIGELPFGAIPAAFITALSQAAGVRFTRLPVAVEDIIRAVESL